MAARAGRQPEAVRCGKYVRNTFYTGMVVSAVLLAVAVLHGYWWFAIGSALLFIVLAETYFKRLR